MALVKYIEHDGTEHEVHVENGVTVMQGAVDNMINGIVAECGGACSCATCHCYVDETWFDKVGSVAETEEFMLECVVAPQGNSRLSCQIAVNDELDGLVVHLPESQYDEPQSSIPQVQVTGREGRMHVSTQGCTWVTETISESEGNADGATAKALLLPVEGIANLGATGWYELEKGFEYKTHRHRDWLVIAVVSGRLKVTTNSDTETCVYEAGDVYLVEPGAVHRETALEDTKVLIVSGPGTIGEQFQAHTVKV